MYPQFFNEMNRMTRFLMMLFVLALILPSCNKGPGEGGTGTVQGFVKLVHHPDDDYTLTPDTMVAAKTDVFIIYGDEAFFGNDVETGVDGMYQFEYLRPGDYTVFAYSTLPSGEKVAVSESVNLQRGAVVNVPTLYIHDGKAYGTSIVKGRVHATYYHNGSYRGEAWACEHRVYIRRVGEDIPLTTPVWVLMAILLSRNYNLASMRCLPLPTILAQKSLILSSKPSPLRKRDRFTKLRNNLK